MHKSLIDRCLLFTVYKARLSGQSDKYAERQIFAIAVAEDQFAEIQGFISCLHAECLLHYGLSQDCRITVRVEVQDHETVLRGEDGCNALEHFVETFVEFPFLSVRTMTVCGRVEDDALICVASLGFPAGKFQCILNNPADVVQTTCLHISACPCDYLTHRVEVGDVRSRCLCSKRGGSGVGEQVEYLWLRFSLGFRLLNEGAGLPVDIFPVR